MPFLERDFGTTHYKIDGSEHKECVLLIHGGSMGLWQYEPITELFSNHGLCVIRYDLIGHGLSSYPEDEFHFSLLEGQSIEVFDTLCRQFDTVYVIGHSLGAAVAASLLAHRETEITKTVLTAPMLDFISTELSTKVLRTPYLGYSLMGMLGRFYLKQRRLNCLANSGAMHLKEQLENQYSRTDYWKVILKLLRGDALESKERLYEALQQKDVSIIYGTSDHVIPEHHFKSIQQLMSIANDKVRTLQGSPHDLFLKSTNQTFDTIIDVLGLSATP